MELHSVLRKMIFVNHIVAVDVADVLTVIVIYYRSVVKCVHCTFFFGRKTIGELCKDMEVVRSTDSTFGNLEMTFKLNKVSIF